MSNSSSPKSVRPDQRAPAVADTPAVVDTPVVGKAMPVAEPSVVDKAMPVPPPQHAVVDPAPVAPLSTGPVSIPEVRVHIICNEASVAVGGGHYSLVAGSTMALPQPIADELVSRRLAERL